MKKRQDYLRFGLISIVILLGAVILYSSNQELSGSAVGTLTVNTRDCRLLDKARDAFTDGSISFRSILGQSVTRYDACMIHNNPQNGWLQCTGPDCGVFEFYCSSTTRYVREFIPCTYGCRSGKCVSQSDPSLRNEPIMGGGVSITKCTTSCG